MPPKKVQPIRTVDDNDEIDEVEEAAVDEAVDNLVEFDLLRARAERNPRRRKQKRVTSDFVLGKEWGFGEEIRVKFPLGVEKARAFFYAQRDGDPFEQLRVFLESYQYNLVWNAIADEEDSEDLFVAIMDLITDHIAGRGANAVPGGSTRS